MFRPLTDFFGEPPEMPPTLARAVGPERFEPLSRAIGPRVRPDAPRQPLPPSSAPPPNLSPRTAARPGTPPSAR